MICLQWVVSQIVYRMTKHQFCDATDRLKRHKASIRLSKQKHKPNIFNPLSSSDKKSNNHDNQTPVFFSQIDTVTRANYPKCQGRLTDRIDWLGLTTWRSNSASSQWRYRLFSQIVPFFFAMFAAICLELAFEYILVKIIEGSITVYSEGDLLTFFLWF